MKCLGTKALVLLFVALVVQCVFDGLAQASVASPSPEDSTFCAIVDTASLEIAPPIQPVPQASLGEAIDPPPSVYSLWFMAQSIDHPPEQSA